MDMMEYDPERALWRPGRRSFLFMFGSAAVGLALPPAPVVTLGADDFLAHFPTDAELATPKWVVREVARYFQEQASFVKYVDRPYSDRWVQGGRAITVRLS